MTTESITVSIDKAKELKAAGWPQGDSVFHWDSINGGEMSLWHIGDVISYGYEESYDEPTTQAFAAPTSEEILQDIRKRYTTLDQSWQYLLHELRLYHGDVTKNESYMCDKLADIAASWWIYLSKNNLLPSQPL